jgi:hypothetical protein
MFIFIKCLKKRESRQGTAKSSASTVESVSKKQTEEVAIKIETVIRTVRTYQNVQEGNER